MKLSHVQIEPTEAGAPAVIPSGVLEYHEDTGKLYKSDGATKTEIGAGGAAYTNEEAQDAVGTILVDSSTIDFTYTDATPEITAIVIDNSITDAKLRNSAALSVIGRSANSAGDPADIAGSTVGHVLQVLAGPTVGFGVANPTYITTSLPCWDNRPPSPSAYDDEFDTGTLDAKWTMASAGTTNPVAAGTIDYTASLTTPIIDAATVPSCLMFQSDNSSNANFRVSQTFTQATDETHFVKILANQRNVGTNGEGAFYLELSNSADANEIIAAGTTNSGTLHDVWAYVNNNGAVSGVSSGSVNEGSKGMPTYIAIWKKSNDYYIGIAGADKGLLNVFTVRTKTGVTTFDTISLILLTANETPSIIDGVDFYRYYDYLEYSLVNEDSGSGGLYTDEMAQDAIGAMVDTTIVYTDGTPLLSRAALTGDVTAPAGSNATTIASNAVTFGKMQDIATNSLIGRDTAASGDPENILLNATLEMDGAGNLQRSALTGDVTSPAGSNSTTIANDAVTYAKIQNVTDERLIGRSAGSSGDAQEITVGTGLSLSAGALTNTVSAFTTEDAQDAVGAMVDTTLVYTDVTPLLVRAALTGHVTAPEGSNTTTIADKAVSYAKIQDINGETLIGRQNGPAGVPQEITIGDGLSLSLGVLENTRVQVRVVGVTFDGNGSPPTAGSIGYAVCTFNGTITGWHIVGDVSGSSVVDVWKASSAIPTDSDRIAGTEKPTLSASQLSSDLALSTWTSTTAFNGDVFGFELESASTLNRVTVEIIIQEP